MENYKKAAAIITLLTIIFTAGLSTNYALADDYLVDENTKTAQEEALGTIEANDYGSWRKIVSYRSEIANLITEKDFEDFVLARQAARNGEYDKAIEIAGTLSNALSGKLNS